MRSSRTDTPDVLIAGGGVAALEAALALQALADGRLGVELIAPEPHFWYRPLAVAEPFALGEVQRFELATLAGEAGATFSLGELVSVDAARRIAYTTGGAVPYRALLIACGAVPKPGVRGALTFRGPADTPRFEELLREVETGTVSRVVFAVPAGAAWALPIYELALMTAAWTKARDIEHVTLSLVTPESEPLQLFGEEASDAVRTLLEESGIAIHMRAYAADARPGELLLVGDRILVTDRVVALPRLEGPRIGGIPQTFEGFVPVDRSGRVTGMADVYAAGDITTYPVKHGGLAAQQAEAAAEAIAAEAGVEVTPRPFRPVLRGLLLTGARPRYLRAELEGGVVSEVSPEPLWWPPAKIAGRYLAPFLARFAGREAPADAATEAGVPVEVELDHDPAGQRRDRLLEAAVESALGESERARVADVMVGDPLVIAPEDTLGEVAERMREHNVGSAVVAHYGRLIGILTSRDLLDALAARVHSSQSRVREWMTAEPIAVSPDSTLEAAAILMTEHEIHHLPVVEGERAVGMVGLRDVIRSAAPFADTRARVGLGF
jgi:sulfide:quinone oxidoreductase